MKARLSIFLPAAALGLAAVLALAGCGRRDAPADGVAAAWEARAAWTLATNVVHIGDPVEAVLRIDHPAGSSVQLPDPGRQPGLEVRGREVRTQRADGELRTTARYRLTSFEVGRHVVATGAVQYVTAGGDSVDLPLQTARLEVRSILSADGEDPHGLRDLAHWARRSRLLPWAALLIVSVLAAVLAARWAIRRRKHPATKAASRPPPHATALAALERLRASGWIEEERGEAFYVEISGIIRRYIEERFGLRAPERTTEEFIREAAGSRALSAEHQGLTRGFLEQCDLVKFARHRPARTDMTHALRAAERLVRETIPPQEETA